MKFIVVLFIFSASMAFGQSKNKIQKIDRILISEVKPIKDTTTRVIVDIGSNAKTIMIDGVLDTNYVYVKPVFKDASVRIYDQDEIRAMPRESDVLNSLGIW